MYVYIYAYIYMHMCKYPYMCMCMYVYIYTNIQKCTGSCILEIDIQDGLERERPFQNPSGTALLHQIASNRKCYRCPKPRITIVISITSSR